MTDPQPKRLDFEDESPLGYFSKLTEFIYDPHYARYLRRIAERYRRDLLPEDLDLMPFFVDALIFETYIDGQTPLDRFLSSYASQLTQAQRRVYQNFKHYLFSCYRIVSHPGSDGILLEDLLDGSQVLIRDGDARRQLMTGLYTVARLLPFADYHVPTGACAMLSYQDPAQVLEITRLLKLPPLIVSA